MAEILIQGMELPKACQWYDENGMYHDCRMTYGGVCNITGQVIAMSVEQRHPSCPLVTLPSHGRLISDTALLHTLTHLKGATEHDTELLRAFEKMVRECPTVVEAST